MVVHQDETRSRNAKYTIKRIRDRLDGIYNMYGVLLGLDLENVSNFARFIHILYLPYRALFLSPSGHDTLKRTWHFNDWVQRASTETYSADTVIGLSVQGQVRICPFVRSFFLSYEKFCLFLPKVHRLLKEATSEENLCLMYCGWMPFL